MELKEIIESKSSAIIQYMKIQKVNGLFKSMKLF